MVLAALFGDLFIQLDYFSFLAWAFRPRRLPSDHLELTLCGDPPQTRRWGHAGRHSCRRLEAAHPVPSLHNPAGPALSPPVTELPLGDEGAQLGDVTRNAEGAKIRCHCEPLDGPFHHLPQGQSVPIGT